jgi:hypothetical protein
MWSDKRQRIINLELFTRSNPLYKSFENRTKFLNDVEISYIFCKECETRAKDLNFINEWFECRDNSIDDKENYPLIYNKKFEALKVINMDLYTYYNNLMETVTTQSLEDSISKQYSVKTMIDEPILLKILGKKRLNELLYDGFPQIIQDEKGFPYLDFENFLTLITDDEVIKIKKYIKLNPFGFRTMVLRDYAKIERNLTSSYFVEIDFTKPIEEIENFIKILKNDFKENPKKLPTMYDILKIRHKKIKFHTLKSEIYKNTNRKSNSQLLADILFIFDCYKAKYTQEDIQIEFKHYYGYGIKKETLKKYLNFAKEYINNNKFMEFIKPKI